MRPTSKMLTVVLFVGALLMAGCGEEGMFIDVNEKLTIEQGGPPYSRPEISKAQAAQDLVALAVSEGIVTEREEFEDETGYVAVFSNVHGGEFFVATRRCRFARRPLLAYQLVRQWHQRSRERITQTVDQVYDGIRVQGTIITDTSSKSQFFDADLTATDAAGSEVRFRAEIDDNGNGAFVIRGTVVANGDRYELIYRVSSYLDPTGKIGRGVFQAQVTENERPLAAVDVTFDFNENENRVTFDGIETAYAADGFWVKKTYTLVTGTGANPKLRAVNLTLEGSNGYTATLSLDEQGLFTGEVRDNHDKPIATIRESPEGTKLILDFHAVGEPDRVVSFVV